MFQLGLCIDKSKNHGGGTSDHEENKPYASIGLMALDGHDRNHALDELFPSVTLVAKPCRSQEATGPEFW
ncbi:hypothetical protein MCOR23_005541 [Pyricularia oryzae]|nr:hypothetical protein MCOR23_005541 [Pyricularia oryzae]KAI6521724.1 hypothetical protein MCOR16_007815 [Pyricularia oryzae]KAI6580625.1 hypothetical protein MCOR06_009481 [Pyricularia oryzae]